MTTIYRMYSIRGPEDVRAAVAEYRQRYGASPAAVLLADVPEDVTEVDGVPVQAEPDIALPAGLAYLQVAR